MATEGGGDSGDTDPTQQIEGGVATGGEMGRGAVRADLAGVFTPGDVADVMQPVLDVPMAAPQVLQCSTRAASACWGGKLVRANDHSSRLLPAPAPLPYAPARWLRQTRPRPGQPGPAGHRAPRALLRVQPLRLPQLR